MDTTHLQSTKHLLLDYLIEKGYKDDSLWMTRKCLKLAIEEGHKPEICSYEDFYGYAAQQFTYQPGEPRYKKLKSYIGLLWNFDINGKYPQGVAVGFMAGPSKYESLSNEFKEIIDNHSVIRKVEGKTNKTIYTEYRAALNFFLFMQDSGANALTDIEPRMICGFFHDGNEVIRRGSYCHLIKMVLGTVVDKYREQAMRIIRLLPKIREPRKLFDYLLPEESRKVYDCLKNEQSSLSHMERAMGWILYFVGLRGTDIASLGMQNIDWKHESIHLVQSKTGVPLNLPLNAAMGNSLFDYITVERPSVDSEKIFLHATHPHTDFQEIGSIINKVFDAAGVRTQGRARGVRVMRHHLVTSLLVKGTDCATVSSIVGHKHEESLHPYVDTDIEHLKACAISIERYPVDNRVFAI
ncbi:MAG: tyrosine-type recombinase/integrase [Dehalococcoidales bacterium]|nr:tyrosine-type recombinase/integrase [Dehalococcoidia bacterium]